jgi:hypothetical protein
VNTRAGAFEIRSCHIAKVVRPDVKPRREPSLVDRFLADHRCERCLARVRVMLRVDADTVLVQCLGCAAAGSMDVSGLENHVARN